MVVPSLTLLAGLVLGCVVGSQWQRAVRAWADLRKHKAQIPGLRAAAFLAARRAALSVPLAVALAVFALYAAAKGHK